MQHQSALVDPCAYSLLYRPNKKRRIDSAPAPAKKTVPLSFPSLLFLLFFSYHPKPNCRSKFSPQTPFKVFSYFYPRPKLPAVFRCPQDLNSETNNKTPEWCPCVHWLGHGHGVLGVSGFFPISLISSTQGHHHEIPGCCRSPSRNRQRNAGLFFSVE